MSIEKKVEAYKNWQAFRCWFKWSRLTIMFNSGQVIGLLRGRIQTLKDVLEGIVPAQVDAAKQVIRDEIQKLELELEEVLQGKHG